MHGPEALSEPESTAPRSEDDRLLASEIPFALAKPGTSTKIQESSYIAQ